MEAKGTKAAPALTGGKGGRGKGNGGGRGKGGRGQGNGKGRGQGKGGRGGKNGSCYDSSPCMKAITSVAGGKKGEGAPQLPPAHVAAIMEENLRVARKNIDWLQRAASAIDITLLQKTHMAADMCVPRGSIAIVDAVMTAHKDLMSRANDIMAHVKELSLTLNVPSDSFRDALNKEVPLSDFYLLEQLLVDGNLTYGGIDMRGVLRHNNPTFIRRILEADKDADPSPLPIGLRYSATDKTFEVSYDTASGNAADLVFTLGIDGQAISPHIDRLGRAGHHEVLLLSRAKAEELALLFDMNSKATSSSMRSRRSSALKTSSKVF